MNDLSFTRILGAATVVAGLCWNLPAQDPDAALIERPDTTLIQDMARPGQPVRVSTRWIGVVCAPADDVLRSHLDLPQGAGLVVQSIVPGSPAEEAGLQQHDILVAVNGTPLTGLEQLVEAVEDSEGNAMNFTWLRKGKEHSQAIAPAMRPTEMHWTPDDQGSGWQPDVDTEALQEWVEKLKQDPQGSRPFEFRFFGPGIVPGDDTPPFSGSLSVEITKEGDAPTRIKVRRGDETWEVTDETLDELPEDLRGRIEGMIGQGAHTGLGRFQVFPLPIPLSPTQAENFQRLQELQIPRSDLPPVFQQQFDEMHRRMEEMMRQLNELREHQEPQENGDVDA